MLRYQTVLILTLAHFLGGCVFFEVLGGVPRGKEVISVPEDSEVSVIFQCVKTTVGQLHARNAFWGDTVDFEDAESGLLEMGGYSNAGQMGFRLKAELIEAGALELDLKAVGIMYNDLGVSEGLDKLKTGIAECVGV